MMRLSEHGTGSGGVTPAASRDRTDLVSWASAAAAALGIVVLTVVGGSGDAAPPRPSPPADRTVSGEAALRERLGHWPPSTEDRAALEDLAAAEPANAAARLALGDLAREAGKLDEAASWYRLAVRADRGVTDRTSPAYAGERLARLVDEGLRVYLRERDLRPGDKHVKEVIEDLYLIRRALAGGCD